MRDERTADEIITLEPSGSFESADNLRRTPGARRRRAVVYLQDVARVERVERG